MDATSNLNLPFIMAAQAQKHVTHNESLRALDALVQLMVLDKDLSAPPGSPAEGARYIVASSPTGAWSGQAGSIAAYQDAAWAFYPPREGWAAWVADEDQLYVWGGTAWGELDGAGGIGSLVEDTTPQLGGDLDANGHGIGFDSGTGITDDAGNEQLVFHKAASAVNQMGITNAATGGAPQIAAEGGDANIDLVLAGKGSGHPKAAVFGVNASADATTRLAVSAAASLFNHAGSGHQHKINKNAAGDTASLIYQTNFSGRAEMGTTGDDDFHFKVSPDGSSWKEAILIDKSTGMVRLPSTVETIVLGPAVVNLASTTAVQIGTTPAGARFVPLEIILLCTAASAPAGVASSTLGVGQTGAGFTDWLSTSLDATFNAQHESYRYNLPASATAILSAPASTALFAKMGTAISGGSMSMKVWVRGILAP